MELQPWSVLELERDLEITTHGSLAFFAFSVERTRLEAVEAGLAGGSPDELRSANRVLSTASRDSLVSLLRAGVRRALEGDLAHLASRLRRSGKLDLAKPESESRRRRAVRRVEEYLEAHEREVPSVADLSAIAGVSEHTLEYAIREQIGLPLLRYLRLRRLNAVRRELMRGEQGAARVTDVAMRWGFRELGRFAQEYRALFGERPSATLMGPVSGSR